MGDVSALIFFKDFFMILFSGRVCCLLLCMVAFSCGEELQASDTATLESVNLELSEQEKVVCERLEEESSRKMVEVVRAQIFMTLMICLQVDHETEDWHKPTMPDCPEDLIYIHQLLIRLSAIQEEKLSDCCEGEELSLERSLLLGLLDSFYALDPLYTIFCKDKFDQPEDDERYLSREEYDLLETLNSSYRDCDELTTTDDVFFRMDRISLMSNVVRKHLLRVMDILPLCPAPYMVSHLGREPYKECSQRRRDDQILREQKRLFVSFAEELHRMTGKTIKEIERLLYNDYWGDWERAIKPIVERYPCIYKQNSRKFILFYKYEPWYKYRQKVLGVVNFLGHGFFDDIVKDQSYNLFLQLYQDKYNSMDSRSFYQEVLKTR